jgi:crossover junction endonuclease MUS81
VGSHAERVHKSIKKNSLVLVTDNVRTLKRDEAEVSQTDDGDLLFRIEYRVAQDLHPIVRGLKKVEALSRAVPLPGGMTKSAYMRERVSNDPAPGFPDKRTVSSESMARKAAAAPSDDPVASLLGGYTAPAKSSKGAMYAPPTAVRILGGGGDDSSTSNKSNGTARGVANVSDILARFKDGGPALSSSPHAGTSASMATGQASGPTRRPAPVTTEPSVSPKRPCLSASDILAAAPRATGPTSSDNPLQASFEAPALARPGSNGRSSIVNRHPLDPVRDYVSAAPYVYTPFAPIVWPRGSFQVYLIVDSREGTREAGKRVELCEKMEREGVRVDGKMMPLGDMIWVARRVDPVTKRPTGADDVVLDAIVERKRLDDLCNSIIDGRYVGQKVRWRLENTRSRPCC